jgi:hypothetical protein
MKLFCVDNLGNPNKHCYPLFVGNEYTYAGEVDGHPDYYFIAEHPRSKRGNLAAYNKQCFATLPIEDQEKEVECEKEAIIYQR